MLGRFVIFVALVPLFMLAACDPISKQASVIQSNPQIFQKGYSQTEQEQITRGFKARPQQYSQQYGQMILWKMHQKSPQFAKEFAQTPELNDGINPAEARAMQHIYNLVSRVPIPRELIGQNPDTQRQGYEFVVTWRGNKQGELGVLVGNTGYRSTGNKVIAFRPIGLEQNDSAEFNERYGSLRVRSNTGPNDEDGVYFVLTNPNRGNLLINFNSNLLNIPISQIYSGNGVKLQKNQFGYDLGGTLTINKPNDNSSYSLNQRILAEMINAGSGEQRFSAPMQAMLWLYLDGKVKDVDNPLKDYASAMFLAKDTWGDMEGPRWKDFDAVTSRLNTPELLHYYDVRNIVDEDYVGTFKTPKGVFEDKKGNCFDVSLWNKYVLQKNGFSAEVSWVEHEGFPEGHIITIFEDKGAYFVLNKDGPNHRLEGPFKEKKDIPYKGMRAPNY